MTTTTTTPAMADLLPCPFCGADDPFVSKEKHGVTVRCGEAACNVAGAFALTEATAADRWNRRAAQPAEGSAPAWGKCQVLKPAEGAGQAAPAVDDVTMPEKMPEAVDDAIMSIVYHGVNRMDGPRRIYKAIRDTLAAQPAEGAGQAGQVAKAGQHLINAGALRQYRHNDGSEGFVFAYDKAITDREFARLSTTERAAAPADQPQAERLQKACDIMHKALCDISQPANAGCGCSFPCRCETESAEALNATIMRDLAIDALCEAESVIDFGETLAERAQPQPEAKGSK